MDLIVSEIKTVVNKPQFYFITINEDSDCVLANFSNNKIVNEKSLVQTMSTKQYKRKTKSATIIRKSCRHNNNTFSFLAYKTVDRGTCLF